MDICHVTGNGSYRLINVSSRAQAAHMAHGDSLPFGTVPGGFVFYGACNALPLTVTVEKTSTTTVVLGPGPVPYSYLVTNLGTVPITGLTLSDDHVDVAPVCLLTTIPVAGSTTCAATYTVTQADLDANGSPLAGSGVLFNTVTASSNEAPDAIDDLSIPMDPTATLTVEKTSTTTVVSAPGPVPYSYLVTNTGIVAITGLALSDDHVDAAPVCLLTIIPVAGSTTCAATYTVTQADLDANGSPLAGSGVLFNTVTASSNEAPHATDDLSIPIE